MAECPPVFRPHGSGGARTSSGDKRAVRQRYDRRTNAAKRGYGHKWRNARLTFLDANPLCVCCLRDGTVEPATTVDHIVPHDGNIPLFWKRWNWQALCQPCHSRYKQSIESKWRAGKLSLEGLFLGKDEEKLNAFLEGYERMNKGGAVKSSPPPPP